MTTPISFPQGFLWGTATSSYQIEGGAGEDGRGTTIWDEFSHTPGKILNNQNGDIACDHYHRWKDDVKLMKALGIKAYRFSMAWSRILPEGRGRVNPAGLNYYDRLIDRLLNAGITPMVTLYHWDLPSALPGGWLNRATVDAFVEYTVTAARAFGDRVKDWLTVNEPQVSSFTGYAYGMHAPGHRSLHEGLTAAHHLLLAHGAAMTELRRVSQSCRPGIALNLTPVHPASESSQDRSAARHLDGEVNRWFLDPIFGRGYPADMAANYARLGAWNPGQPECVRPGDMEKIAAPLAFLGINYYSRAVVGAGEGFSADPADIVRKPAPPDQVTGIGWEIYPRGLYEILTRVQNEYHPTAIMITENGASFADAISADGQVHDAERTAYLNLHLAEAARAIQAGVPLKGYYAWSLMDNFEWTYGYNQRFGLVYVDFNDQRRIPKDSAAWYGKVIRTNQVIMD